jgi:1-acyl-sn-glycerol-3-phosphate acyltransferase
MRTFISVWSWVAVGVVILIGFAIQVTLAVLTLPFDRRRYVCGRTLRLVGVAASKVIPAWHFGVAGETRAPIPGRTVVVSNHCSQADPFLISHLPWEMKWLSKKSLFRIPFVGWAMWIAGDVPLNRGDARSAHEAMRKCAEWLDRGVPIMMFPEGTRSADGALLPFKDGAFRLAIENHAQVLPIAVEGTHTALPKHSWHFGRSNARVQVGTPIATEGLSIDELKEQARTQIEQMRERLKAAG